MTSASAGSSRSVRRKKCERRVTTRVKSREPDAAARPIGLDRDRSVSAGRRARAHARHTYTDLVPARRSRLVPATATGALVESLAALRQSLDLPGDFPPAVLAEAQDAAHSVSTDPADAGLADLRDLEFLTIDPEGSPDLDQAMHIQRTASGAVLHYAIADVPAFVTPGGALDTEARRRGQTLYAADGRIPLHPPVLSEDAASLVRERRPSRLSCGGSRSTTARVRCRRRSRAPSSDHGKQVELRRRTGGARARIRARDPAGARVVRAAASAARERARRREPQRARDDHRGRRRRLPSGTQSAAADRGLERPGLAADRDGGGRDHARRRHRHPPHDAAPPTPPMSRAFRAQTIALGIPWADDIRYGDYLRTLDREDPAALAVRSAAASLFRGAGYVAFDGPPPAQTLQAAIGAPYAHTTAPLRRLVDRWSLVICEALANGRPVPDWARQSLPDIPKLMGRSDAARRPARRGIDQPRRGGPAARARRLGVLRRRAERARRRLAGSGDESARSPRASPGLSARAGSTVDVRLERADIATGAIEFAPVDAARGRRRRLRSGVGAHESGQPVERPRVLLGAVATRDRRAPSSRPTAA